MADANGGIELADSDIALDSAYRAFMAAKDSGTSLQPLPRTTTDPADSDPMGMQSSAAGDSGHGLATPNTVLGLTLPNGSYYTRDELLATEEGESLLRAEEDIRRGNKRGFFSTLFSGSYTDLVPFVGTIAAVNGSFEKAKMASNAAKKELAGESMTDDEAIALALYRRDNILQRDGTWGSMLASVIRGAPAMVFEFGVLGKAGQVLRTAAAAKIVQGTGEATAKRASAFALSRAVKIGADEYAEAAIRSLAASEKAAKTTAEMASELLSNQKLFSDTASVVAKNVKGLMSGAANYAAPEIGTWAPGLVEKTAQIRAATALRSAASRMSSEHAVVRAWDGLRKSMADAAVSGLIDLGRWGTEAGSVINTGYASAGKAALDAVAELTVGAAARGAALFFPRNTASAVATAWVPGGTVGRATLQLQDAAAQNDDPELMERAERYGMFLDLLEYVSENTGRGFNGLFRSAGLAVAPKLMAPARRVAGIPQITSASILRNAEGEAVGAQFLNGLVDADKSAQVGGVIRRYAERTFGGKVLREDVAADKLLAVKRKLGGLATTADDVALSATIDSGKIASGLSPKITEAIGGNVPAYVRAAVKEANAARLTDRKIKGFHMFLVADFMARRNLDPVSTIDWFATAGYDGIVAEMLEERYSDVVSALFGIDAEKDHSVWENIKRATAAALVKDDKGQTDFGRLAAEAVGFAIPMMARGMIMRSLSSIGTKNGWQKWKDWSAQWADATRSGVNMSWNKGDYIVAHAERVKRLSDAAVATREAYIKAEKDGANAAELETLKEKERRTRKAVRRLSDIKAALFSSLTPDELSSEETQVQAPVFTDTQLMSSDEEYNLALTQLSNRATTQSAAAYKQLMDFAAEAGQMLYKSDAKTAEEDTVWYRRAAHKITETTLRLAGVATTGELGFLSVNPARWVGNDIGLPDDVQVALELGYGKLFREELSSDQADRARKRSFGTDIGEPSQADIDGAHERAFKRFQPQARKLMADLLARHQSRMFSDSEIQDVALAQIARELHFASDPESRTFVSPIGEKISYDQFAARSDVANKLESKTKDLSFELYRMLSGQYGSPTRATVGRAPDVLVVPKGLPTERQAILFHALSEIPALHSVLLSREADPDRTVDDQLRGMATDTSWLDHISSTVLPTGTVTSKEDFDTAVKLLDKVDSAIVESVARDLHFEHDGTTAGIARRNRLIVRYALLASGVSDRDVMTFSRPSGLAERDDRFGSAFGFLSTARRGKDGWSIVVVPRGEKARKRITAATPEALGAELAKVGYTKVDPKVVHTAATTIQSADPFAMLRTLNLGMLYKERMLASKADDLQLDPLLRKDSEANFLYSHEEADRVREEERMFSDMFEAHHKQEGSTAWVSYLQPGEKPSDPVAEARAKEALDKCRAAWYRRNARDTDGNAIGYAAIADDLLHQHGVRVPSSATDNAFGMAHPSFRGKYVISVRALRDVGATGNVYVPIDHGSAQDYESSLLDGALLAAYARNRGLIGGVGAKLIADFAKDARKKMLELEDTIRKTGENPALADRIAELRMHTVEPRGSAPYRMSPFTFAKFVSAFCMFRTEVASGYLNGEQLGNSVRAPADTLRTVLGNSADALVAVAEDIRNLPSYIGFVGIVDRVLGGDGFESDLTHAAKDPLTSRGLAKFVALFSPLGSESFAKAVEKAFPKLSYSGFVEQVTATLATNQRPRFLQMLPARPAGSPESAATAAMTVITVASEVSGKTPAEVIAEVRAGSGAGTVDKTVEILEPAAVDQAGEDEGPSDDDIRRFRQANADLLPEEEDLDGLAFALSAVKDIEPAVGQDGTVVSPAPRNVTGLLPSEAKTIARTFHALTEALLDRGSRVNLLTWRDVVRRLVPDIREADEAAIKAAWKLMKNDGTLAPDTSIWAWLADKDEEGVVPDGADGFVQRSAEVLKSKAFSEFLAMMEMVAPSSGRDFQPFVDDLRSLSARLDTLYPAGDMPKELASANAFLDKIINPRKEDTVDTAPGRDAKWRHLMSWFDAGSPHSQDITRYVAAFLGESGKPPVCARAALLLTYLKMLPTNVRMQMASYIASSAPANPVAVKLTFDVSDGGRSTPIFTVSEAARKGGHMSAGTISSAFGRLAKMTPAQLEGVAQSLSDTFRAAVGAGKLAPSKSLREVFKVWAQILAPEFGADSPLVTMLLSRTLDNRLVSAYRSAADKTKTDYAELLGKFTTTDSRYLPFAAHDLVTTIRTAAKEGPSKLVQLAAEMFASGSRSARSVGYASTSLRGFGVWTRLMRAYSDAKPVTMMTAETDPERTSRPQSSLAITVCGIEPSVQEFLDRKDEDGFKAVLRKWFPALATDKMSDADFNSRVAVWRQRMIWPSARGDSIIAKTISKSMYATEVLAGCVNSYERGVEGNLVFVPVYSGDHSSSILIQVPLAKEFKGAGMDYTAVSEMVSRWVGLDLLGADAKRSALTSVEAPGTGMFDFAYDDDGNIVTDAEGNKVQGHAYVSIVWNSDPTSDNEAMIGSTGFYGYGAMRQQELAKDPGSRTVKCHIASVGEDEVYGPALSLIKSLTIAEGIPDPLRGQFVTGSAMEFIERHAKGIIKGEENRSSVIVTDFDSIKLAVANSKTMGVLVSDKKGGEKLIPLMTYVFSRVEGALNGSILKADGSKYDIGTEVDTSTLDELVGDIKWMDYSRKAQSRKPRRLSQLIPAPTLREINRGGKDVAKNRMFSLTYRADNLMAFTVANVSHRGHAETGRTPRNYMLDTVAMARTLEHGNADVRTRIGKDKVLLGLRRTCDGARDLVSLWGVLGSIMATDKTGLKNVLDGDEEYQMLLARGEAANGDLAQDYVRRKYAEIAQKFCLNVPVNGIDAPLVTNAGWINDDGTASSHSLSRMFNDTLQGARTIGRADRKFWRAHKRSAICNVNVSDKSFRYGMYVLEDDLLKRFKLVADGVAAENNPGLSQDKLVALVLEKVISGIYSQSSRAVSEQWDWNLACCLIDHHGGKFVDRVIPSRRKRIDKDGHTVLNEDGAVVYDTITTPMYKLVSWQDLFSAVTAQTVGTLEFDRAAIHPAMFNDVTGRNHVYLAGTLFGLPRTPSYNGSMWLQTARAGLPVTEMYDEEKKQWRPGVDAMVAPDPFTLKILGCDHDGDKSKLYMFTTPKKNVAPFRDMDKLAALIDRVVEGKISHKDAVDELVSLGVVEYETQKTIASDGSVETKKGALVLTPGARDQISNEFALLLFDMNRALPVMSSADNAPFAVGEVSDGTVNRGAASRSTSAKMSPALDKHSPAEYRKLAQVKRGAKRPEASWEIVQDGMAPKLLDVASGRTIGSPYVAARVQTGASKASEARAIMVNMASALHFAYASGLSIGPVGISEASARDFLDFMYHVDHLSNMTFDDVKEQVCGRLGVVPGMIETLFVDILNSSESLPTTDQEFNAVLVKFAKECFTEDINGSSRYWMARSSDAADYDFRALWGEFITGNGFTGKTLPTSAEVRTKLGVSAYGAIKPPSQGKNSPKEGSFAEILWASGATPTEYVDIINAVARARAKSPILGYVYYVAEGTKDLTLDERISEAKGLIRWFNTSEALAEAKDFAQSVNFMHADLASPNADQILNRVIKSAEWIPSTSRSKNMTSMVRRMQFAVKSLYGKAAGMTVAERGIEAAENFVHRRDNLAIEYGLSDGSPSGEYTDMALLVQSLYGCDPVDVQDNMACEANAQTVPWALAAFARLPEVSGSPLNSSNIHDVLTVVGRSLATRRHKQGVDVKKNPVTAYGSNMTLDVLYGIETMLDVVARFVTSSTVNAKLPVFGYLRQVPNSNKYTYRTETYGPAASDLYRTKLSLDSVTEGQIDTVRSLFTRAIDDAELDGVKSYVPADGKSSGGSFGFDLSVSNLRKMKAAVNGTTVEDAAVRKTIDDLIVVFEALDGQYGKGYTIKPSALLGQLLPLYSALTQRVTGAPGSDSTSILSVLPRVQESWSRFIADCRADEELGLWMSIATGIDYSPYILELPSEGWDEDVLRVQGKESATLFRGLPSFSAVEKEYIKNSEAVRQRIVKALAAGNRFAFRYTTAKDLRKQIRHGHFAFPKTADPKWRHTLAVFDGPRAVAFKTILSGLRGEIDVPRKTLAPVNDAVTVAPAEAIAPMEAISPVVDTFVPPTSVPTKTVDATPNYDPHVAEIAGRVGALVKMWDKGRVEYTGGSKFAICGIFHTDGDAFESRIEVDVLDEGTPIVTDEQLRKFTKNSDGNYIRSLAVKSNTPLAKLQAMTPGQRFELAKRFRPVGVAGPRNPAGKPGLMPTVGDWKVDALTTGTVLGHITLARQNEDPGVVYHECFHAVMGFMRTLGAFSTAEIKELVGKYGTSAKYGDDWFDEEPAAEDFRKFASGMLDDATKTGIFDKIKRFLTQLWDIVFGGSADLYRNEMPANPLAGIVLSGRYRSSEKTEILTGRERLDRAVRTYVGHLRNLQSRGVEDELVGTAGEQFAGDGTSALDTYSEGFRIGDSVSDFADISDLTNDELACTVESLALTGGGYKGAVDKDTIVDFSGFLTRLYTPGGTSVEAEYGDLGQEYLSALNQFLAKYGPTVPSATVATDTVEATPNEKFESSMFEELVASASVEAVGTEAPLPSWFADEGAYFECAAGHASVKEALRTVAPDRMNTPYGKMFAFARAIGQSIRGGLRNAPSTVDISSINLSGAVGTRKFDNIVKGAVRQLGAVYGVDVSSDTAVRRAVYTAVHELRGMPELIDHVVNPKHGPADPVREVSPAVLTACLATATGLRPRDIAESAIETIDGIASRYDVDNTFRTNVLEPLRRELEMLASEDPTNLAVNPDRRRTVIDAAISRVRAGLIGGGLAADGTWYNFRLGSLRPDDSPDSDHNTNIARYADHILNPDFHAAVHTVLDALFITSGAVRFGRTLGFEPGDPSEAEALAELNAGTPPPMSLGDMADGVSVAPEQMSDPAYDSSFFDQPWFTARHPEDWLDSIMRPQFGEARFRELFQESRRPLIGFHTRCAHLNDLAALMYGLDVLPGAALTAIDADYETKFEMRSGKTRMRAHKKSAAKFLKYDGTGAVDKATGKTISFTDNDARMADLVLKARRVLVSGEDRVVTGVNGISFSSKDNSDPEYYQWDKVVDRSKRGVAEGYSDFDRALVRLYRQWHDDPSSEAWDFVTGPSGLNVYNRLVETACKALGSAKELLVESLNSNTETPFREEDVNDYVLHALELEGLVVAHEAPRRGHQAPVRVEGTVILSASEIDKKFVDSDAYRKLLRAGRTEEQLSFEAYAKPYIDLFRDIESFVSEHPWLSDGDGAFFHNLSTFLPFIQGSGFFMYSANRTTRKSPKELSEAMNVYEKAFFDMVRTGGDAKIGEADDNLLRMAKILFGLSEPTPDEVRAAFIRGSYEDMTGLRVNADSTVRDLGLAIYNRLVGAAWKRNGDDTLALLGGSDSINRMIDMYERERTNGDSVVVGGLGMTDADMYRMTGILPANHQLGHAVLNAIDGITNAYAYRAGLIGMMTAPDEDGLPVCYAKPAENAAEVSGIPDVVWGTVARWWAQMNDCHYDVTLTGVQNARAVYVEIAKKSGKDRVIDGRRFGVLSAADIDTRSVEEFMACSEDPEGESKLNRLSGFKTGGYALGYAKHLLQSTRGLGPTWQRAVIHRALAYSKGLSVSFSYFFPLATRFESPVGAVGAVATIGGNFAPDLMRKLFGELSGTRSKGWITKDFLGYKDVFEMLDSNDPYLAQLHHWAACLGIGLADANWNPQEHSRSLMQEDLKKVTAYVRKTFGATAARRVDSITRTMFVKGGERAFTYALNATKLATVAQICMKLQAEAEIAGRAFDPVRDLKRYSGYINAEIGGIDPLKYAWAHPGARNVMGSLLFSWEWTRGAWEAGGGTVLEQALFGGHDVTAQERKYLIGRFVRMWLEIGYGIPLMMQFASKAIGLALIAGMDPDDDTLTEEQRRLIKMVRDTPWFTWNNEEKLGMSGFDITPLAAGLAARSPALGSYRRWTGILGYLPAAYGMLRGGLQGKLLLLTALPYYTGDDSANQKTRGRRLYMHFGKQFWESLRWFTDFRSQFFSKLSMPLQRIAEGVFGRSLSWLDHALPFDEQEGATRWINPSMNSAWFNLARAFLPFSATSLSDIGDAGFLSLLGPVQYGQSSSAAIRKLTAELDRWSSNDRRGYEFGGLSRKKGQKVGAALSRRNVSVAQVIADARANGYSEEMAYKLVNTAIMRLTGSLYGNLLDVAPKDGPDGDFNDREFSRLLRKAQRLGRFKSDVYDSIIKRLKEQNRWADMTTEAKDYLRSAFDASYDNPYGRVKDTLNIMDY